MLFHWVKESSGEPFADRDVVDLYACVCYGDGSDEDADGYPYVRAERCVGMLCRPVHLHVDHWIMRDVQRVGDHAEEFA